jgi:hypothetical protein
MSSLSEISFKMFVAKLLRCRRISFTYSRDIIDDKFKIFDGGEKGDERGGVRGGVGGGEGRGRGGIGVLIWRNMVSTLHVSETILVVRNREKFP